MTKIDKYWAVFALHFIQGAKNSKALIGTSIFLLTCLVIFAHIWQAASHHAEIARYAPELLLWYIAFNQWILVASQDINIEIQEELQTGSLAYSMIRPISYLGMKFTQGLGRLSLETGAGEFFPPAHALYRRHGFVLCPPFGSYRDDPNSVFMTKSLGVAGQG